MARVPCEKPLWNRNDNVRISSLIIPGDLCNDCGLRPLKIYNSYKFDFLRLFFNAEMDTEDCMTIEIYWTLEISIEASFIDTTPLIDLHATDACKLDAASLAECVI